MGGAFSHGQDNDELVDSLVESGYIRTKKIEQVFRAVDRGDYFLSSHRDVAYKDYAWKHGNIHLSAPCIYCAVLEELKLKPGMSFLNLGSGTGYLSTMAGLLIAKGGTNHGIELHEDCIQYSQDRLEEFKQKSLALDEFDFCEPVFIQGNCLKLMPTRRYDRVYCGATCPENYAPVIKEFVKIGGILVMPYKDNLVKFKRIEENVWHQECILPASFAILIAPMPTDKLINLPQCDPLPLIELCRENIRQRLRQNVWLEHADLETRKCIAMCGVKPSSSRRAVRQFVIPIYEENENGLDVSDDVGLENRVPRTRLLLNVDTVPGENLRTTLQYVRAVVQADDDENNDENTEDIHHHEDDEWPMDEESASTEEDTHGDTNVSSSERDRHDSESSSDSACEKSHSDSVNNMKEGSGLTSSGLTAYSNISESDSEGESEARAFSTSKKIDDNNEQKDDSSNTNFIELPQQRRPRRSRKDASDSGIQEDVGNGNDEASHSSDSDFIHCTPIKHKRSSSANPFQKNNRGIASWCVPDSIDGPLCSGCYVDSIAFSSYMKEKIHQLPLPHSLKLYINFNRTL
ncbi:uncharacterized protein LOC106653533 [Trichogramma pretiosum]|uniref:uncharacterized protein LOC106653533 n=1 Tax=Trichogramma pretiosum TaxID=7493 RepID=UPI0006C94047|nr:uncharacterized protein LOC106653533 [Trichogramma pretiosum]XP_014228498.1 uncharacterized protein LOC106653533 [Trichogramma pretiosum]XP_014228499.1 uncharacterized protein LOC106653533 [Trichogramma pretiosum]XP_014228501.1 uncharacterized protein LOC106653533 [Trichogramma pretiosum]XP_023315716.1 uncharacterized protein LOC106653533 [Trichogramma pretiosum]